MSAPHLSSAQQTGVCDACGRGIVIAFSQALEAGRLKWSWSAPCASCGKSLGHEGTGTTPSEIRSAILGIEGEWSVALRRPEGIAIAAIKAIRDVYGLGLKEAKDLWDSRGAAGLQGTRVECEALAAQLREDGVECDVMFAGAAIPPQPPPPVADSGDWEVRVRDGSSVAITVIKNIRATFDIGLKEAKDLWDARGPGDAIRGTQAQVEALAASLQKDRVAHEVRSPGGAAASPTMPAEGKWAVVITDGPEKAILAIKAIRSAFGLGLKEAKDVWDAHAPIQDTRGRCEELSRKLTAESVKHTLGPG